ncbi:MAG: DedA family protein, partial [Pseudonocardiaceae bacterium]
MDPKSLLEAAGTLGLLAIVFAESGLLIGFFLPGDSLLFTAGLLASRGFFSLPIILVGSFVAAVAGDQVGYIIGRRTGPALFKRPNSRLFSQKNLERARIYFETQGPKTVVLARFIP